MLPLAPESRSHAIESADCVGPAVPAGFGSAGTAGPTIGFSLGCDRVGQGGVEPPSPGYRPGALPLSDWPSRRVVSAMGSEGVEPPPRGLKGRRAAATPRPRVACSQDRAFSGEHGQPPPFPVGMAGLEPEISWSKAGGFPSLPHPGSDNSIGRPDSNRRLQGLPEQPVRESNPPRRLERAESWADRRTGRHSSGGRVGRVALESTSATLQAAAKPSQLPARRNQRRGPAVDGVTPGLGGRSDVRRPGVSNGADRRASP